MFSAPGYHAIRDLNRSQAPGFAKGDTLVLFGELFTRGYANGLVEAAEARGLKIIRSTVGRREKDGVLRSLNAEELGAQIQPLINIPLEAGFDMEADSEGLSPIDRLKDVKLSEWESAKLSEKSLHEARTKGRARFTNAVKQYLEVLKPHLNPDGNIFFAHLMAGGVPRTKIIMPLMNRTVKGTGDRFLPSEKFWNSDIGRFCSLNFSEVTAHTFDVLLQETAELRQEWTSKGKFVSYSAYGYHGTEVIIEDEYGWQTYTPYLQGWAKMELEELSRKWSKTGAKTCVYNCPEILTNSSSIFQGVEIPLYPLLLALKKENANSPKTKKIWDECQALLKPDMKLSDILQVCEDTLTNPLIREHCFFAKWPQHNSAVQLETILNASDRVTEAHKDPKNLMTAVLSEVVFEACGQVMLENSAAPTHPVSWINHDVVAKIFLSA